VENKRIGECMLVEAYDIFRKDAAALVWVEALPDLQTAEQRVKELAQRSHGEYVIYDQRKQQIVSTFEARFDGR
jgi:hypothetical protein